MTLRRRIPPRDTPVPEIMQQPNVLALDQVCTELMWAEAQVDDALTTLGPDLSDLRQAHLDLERLLSAQAQAEALAPDATAHAKQKVNITGTTKLRWLLDNDSPSFEKVDDAVAATYRKQLLQIYHPDKPDTGNPHLFHLVNELYTGGSLEMLALMVLQQGRDISDEDISRYTGAAERKLARLKAGNCWEVLRLIRTGNRNSARDFLQKLIDKRAALFRAATLRATAASPVTPYSPVTSVTAVTSVNSSEQFMQADHRAQAGRTQPQQQQPQQPTDESK